MKHLSVPVGTNGQISGPIVIKDGDTYIQCNNIAEAKVAEKLAKDLMRNRPVEVKAGKRFTCKGNTRDFIIVVGISLSAVYVYFKCIKPLDKKDLKSDVPPVSTPPLLSKANNKAKTATLNDIGKSNVRMPVQLLGFYAYESDIVWVFSISNTGKTIWSMEAAISLAQGTKPSFLPEGTSCAKRKVLYLNFQMREDQLKKRYFNNTENAVYPDNLEIVFCNEEIKSIDALVSYIAKRLESVNESVVIFIDTAKDIQPTFTANDTETLSSGLRTIQRNFKEAKGHDITYFLVGQTNKKHIYEPIDTTDLSGSFNQMNLADSIIGLGHTRFGKYTRLMKLLKGRVDELPEKVSLLETRFDPYLRPVYVKEAREEDILPLKPKANKNGQQKAPTKTPLQGADGGSGIDKVPYEVVLEMSKWYQKGVPGHGLQTTCEKYGKNYGLKYATEVSRLFEKYGIIEDKKDEGQQ